MIKKLLCICLLGAAPFIGKAQELNARITINSDKVQSTNKQVFKTLQDALISSITKSGQMLLSP